MLLKNAWSMNSEDRKNGQRQESPPMVEYEKP